MKIKVCGMRDANNIRELIELPIDYIGFIFYEKSARYVTALPDVAALNKIYTYNELISTTEFEDGIKGKEFDARIKKVGVFVDADMDFVIAKIKEFDLDIVQLHGKETPDYVYELDDYCMKASNLPYYMGTFYKIRDNYVFPKRVEIWKAFSVDETFNFSETEPYEAYVDKFLFDTKTPLHGGSGQKFDWDILKNYHGKTRFFLSGGISAADTEGVKNIRHPQFFGLDLNSKFEISPALKDVLMLEKFIADLHFNQ
jgi:phosphoribosylanthranilate isomerase